MTSLSPIIQVCDAISGARLVLDVRWWKRTSSACATWKFGLGIRGHQVLRDQAGRELRVMVESDQVSDDQADQLSFDISQRIMNEMTYPGQVKITVIRERRAVSIAR